jgi:hypothetical protein
MKKFPHDFERANRSLERERLISKIQLVAGWACLAVALAIGVAIAKGVF